MRRRTLHAVLLFCAPILALARTPERSPVLTTSHFAFFRDFDTNLNDAPIAAGLARGSIVMARELCRAHAGTHAL